jgi:hypothetical protein
MIAKPVGWRWAQNGMQLLAAVVLTLAALHAQAAAQITIINFDGPGVGFNDATPATPVGGNTGTTLGQQRLNVFNVAAQLWGLTLDSTVPIRVRAEFSALSCTPTSGVLGSAGAFSISANFPNAPRLNTWYHVALASKIAGQDLANSGDPHIRAQFNGSIGSPGCLTGSSWYLGLDNNANSALGQIDLLVVLLHELAHGLGFSTFTSSTTGAQFASSGGNAFPAIWDYYLLDLTTNKRWSEMTNAERVASATNPRGLAWDGATARAGVTGSGSATSGRPAVDGRISRLRADGVLDRNGPQLRVSGGGLSAEFAVGAADFGAAVPVAPLSQAVVAAVDGSTNPTQACNPITNAAQVAGKIALIARGTCGFTVKALNAQQAGAVAVIISDNAAGGPPAGLGGTDPNVTIPAVRITLADGDRLRTALSAGTVTASLSRNVYRFAGAEPRGRPLMYTPTTVAAGSSVSHFDTSASPNLLMEPNITTTLRSVLRAPGDLTFELFRDIGW